MDLSFAIAVGPRQRSYFRVWVPQDSWPNFTVSDSRLPQPGEPDPRIYIPGNRVAQLYPQALGSFPSPPTTHRATVEVFEPASTRALSSELTAPTIPVLTSRHRPHWKHLPSTFTLMSVAVGTCLPSRCPEMCCLTRFINNPLSQQRASFRDRYPATALHATIFHRSILLYITYLFLLIINRLTFNLLFKTSKILNFKISCTSQVHAHYMFRSILVIFTCL
jgi:hypothetical protein